MEHQDKYWKDKFSKPVRAEDWNTPDDSLWDSIDNAITTEQTPEEDNKGFLWLWSSLGLLALVLTSLYLVQGNSINDTDNSEYSSLSSDENGISNEGEGAGSKIKKIAAHTDNDVYGTENPKNITSTVTNEKRITTQSPITSGNADSAVKAPTSLLENNLKLKETKSTTNAVDRDISPQTTVLSGDNVTNPQINSSPPLLFNNIKNPIHANSFSTKKQENNPIRDDLTIPILGRINPLILFNSRHSTPYRSNTIVPITTPHLNKWAFSIQYGHNYIINNSDLNQALASADYYNSSSWGQMVMAGLEYQLNSKWALLGNAQYMRVDIESGHNAALSYKTDNEYIPNHNIFKDQNIATPYGSVKTEINLRRASSLSGDLPLTTDISTEQRIEQASISIGVSYELLSTPKFNIHTSLSSIPRYVFNIESRIKAMDTHSTDVVFHDAITIAESSNYRRWTAGIAPGLSLNYNMTDAWALRLNSSYLKGITPSYIDGDLKTYQDEIQTSAGVLYKF